MKIAYTRPDGGVSILDAMPKESVEGILGPLTDDEYRAHIKTAIPPDAADVTELPDDWVKPDKARRNAWRLRDGQVVIAPRSVALDEAAA